MSFISPLGIKDVYGTNVGSYEIQYDPGLLDITGHGMAFIISLFYSILVQPIAGLATWIISKVADPKGFFVPVEKAYQSFLEPLVSIINPTQFAVLVASATFLVMFFRRSSVVSGPRNDVVQKALYSYLLIIFATALALQPFKFLRKAFELTNGIINDITRGVSESSVDGSMSAHFLTVVTQLINFGRQLNDSASREWSQALGAGRDIKDVSGIGDVIKDVSPSGAFTALAAGGAGIAMIVFAVVALAYMTYYLWELTWRTVAVPWFMFYSAFRFRQMHLIWETLGRIASYLGMAVLISIFAIAGPIMATGLAAEIFGDKFAFLQIITTTLAYMLLAWLLHKMCSPTGRFAEVMRLTGRNQWRGYMQRSSILMARDKTMKGAAKVVDWGGKAGGAVATAFAGPAAGAAVTSTTGAASRALESRANSAGAPVSNELPRGKDNMMALDPVPAEAMQTSFNAANPAPALPPGQTHRQMQGEHARRQVASGALADALEAGRSAEGGLGEKAKAAIAGGVSGAKDSGQQVFGKGTSGDGSDQPGSQGDTKSADGVSDNGLPILEGEVVEDYGTINSLNFPKSGDTEGVAKFVQLRALASTAQSPTPGREGSAEVGAAPALPSPSRPEPDAGEEAMREATSPLFYEAGESGETRAMVDPRVPMSEKMRAEYESDPDVGFANEEALADTSLPEGVEVFNGQAVWTDPKSQEMVSLSADVGPNMADTVTVDGMRDHANSITDPTVREMFIIHHGLTDDATQPERPQREPEVVDAEVVEDTPADAAAAASGTARSGDSDVVDGEVVDAAPRTVGDTSSRSSSGSGAGSGSTAVPTTSGPAPAASGRSEQSGTGGSAQSATVLSAKSVAPEAAARMATEAERDNTDHESRSRESEKTHRSEPETTVREVRPPESQQQPEKPYTPHDYKADRETLDRHKSAGRAGSSTTSMTGTGQGSVEIPRTREVPRQFNVPKPSVSSSSVPSATFYASADAATAESRQVSNAMAGGGVVPVPVDDPDIASTTFTSVGGRNVVGDGSQFMSY